MPAPGTDAVPPHAPKSRSQRAGSQAAGRPAADAVPQGPSVAALQAQSAAVLGPLTAVAARQDLAPLAARLQELQAWLADDLQDLEGALVDEQASALRLGGGNLRVGRAAAHLLILPGKRIRPLCVLLAARLGGRPGDATVRQVATACELVHAATLLHDDVVDHADVRRGAPAARALYGNAASILAGDHLLVHALRLVQEAAQPLLLPTLLQVMARMVAAEALQLERRGRFAPSRETYLEVIRGKTAALFSWGLRAGGILGGSNAAEQAALERVGLHLGMAFQLVDDVLDVDGSAATMGKAGLQDLREGKITWPIILAAEADPAIAEALTQVAQSAPTTDPAASERRFAEVVRAIRGSGAVAETRAFALEEARLAAACLTALPDGQARAALGWVVESAVMRLA